MKRRITNQAASVHQRLLNLARSTGRPFNELLQYYAIERYLYRLAQSPYRDRLVLKGALMLLVWKTPATRPTRDIDLLARLNNDLEFIRSVVADICRQTVEDDGLVFAAATVTTERIAEDADYEGVRARFGGLLGTLETPERATSLAFGGADRKISLIGARSSIYAIRTGYRE